ncbi:MAG TPA: CocE/NonD family hydrolase [Gemmataceae bacterium]|nr:CocE/NonD family hydrolase [Gemmataceae bacterium]
MKFSVLRACLLGILVFLPQALQPAQGQERVQTALPPFRERYTKQEILIPMRDGVKLFTSIYTPKDMSRRYPILMNRTPYSVSPYGPDAIRGRLGPSRFFSDEGYIFVNQDVRGCYMSEGQFVDMRPHLDHKKTNKDIDESSDTYDTCEWLINNVKNHNGRIGQYGISYPGFYCSAGMIDAHPALKAVSPQAPIADWWYDDFHHHGALFLPHAFNFLSSFGQARPAPTTQGHRGIDHGTPDGYQFFYEMGGLKHANDRYFKGKIGFWNQMVEHPNYDEFWKARNLLPHLKHVAPAVMTVGGWFDAEDLYGAINTYKTIEKQNQGIFNILVMGPWRHGGWAGGGGDRLGNVSFAGKTSDFFQKEIEFTFFQHFLNDKGPQDLPEAYVFETGANHWRKFDTWPPAKTEKKNLYVRAGGKLAFEAPADDDSSADAFVSDPAKPVPFTEAIAIGMTQEYMTDDQRFASHRPDVLTYQTDLLESDLTFAGPVLSDLRVSTNQGDADWVVKLIDVFPNGAKDHSDMTTGEHMGGYEMMVRSEVIRGRFRNGPDKPEPFVADQPTRVDLPLQDVLHTFQKGHRVMIQIQSTWFPLVDRNPQKYVPNIYQADDSDFVKATHKVYRSKTQPTHFEVGVLSGEAKTP